MYSMADAAGLAAICAMLFRQDGTENMLSNYLASIKYIPTSS